MFLVGEKENITHFSIIDNGFKCFACSKRDTGAIKISEPTKNAIKYIMISDPKKIFSFSISEEGKRELEIISSLYLNDKLDKEYKLEKLIF